MDTPSPEDGETVIHTTQRIIINGTSHTGTLTDRRLILVGSEPETPRIIIPFTDIEIAAADTNRLREPVIRITYTTPDGSARGIELIFVYQVGARNVQGRDKSLGLLEEHGVPVRPAPPDAYRILDRKESMQAGTLVVEGTDARSQAPAWSIYGTQDSGKGTREVPAEVSPMLTIAVGILLAAIVIWAMTVPLPEPREPSYLAKISVTPVVTKTVAPAPTPTVAPVATILTIVPLQPGQVPGNGFFVKIVYPGEYTGYLSAGGWRKEIAGFGTQLFQVPVQDTVIDGFIEKTDGSGNTLTVDVYNGGIQISEHTTSKPRGMVEMHVAVGMPIINTSVSTSSISATIPTPVPASVDTSYGIPATGVWAKITYPGNYTGTITTNGMQRDVTGTGSRYVQLVISKGTIDSYLQKEDGSAMPLELEIYKDAILLDRAGTSAPRGIVEMHTIVA